VVLEVVVASTREQRKRSVGSGRRKLKEKVEEVKEEGEVRLTSDR